MQSGLQVLPIQVAESVPRPLYADRGAGRSVPKDQRRADAPPRSRNAPEAGCRQPAGHAAGERAKDERSHAAVFELRREKRAAVLRQSHSGCSRASTDRHRDVDSLERVALVRNQPWAKSGLGLPIQRVGRYVISSCRRHAHDGLSRRKPGFGPRRPSWWHADLDPTTRPGSAETARSTSTAFFASATHRTQP